MDLDGRRLAALVSVDAEVENAGMVRLQQLEPLGNRSLKSSSLPSLIAWVFMKMNGSDMSPSVQRFYGFGWPGSPTGSFSTAGVGAGESREKLATNRVFRSLLPVPNATVLGWFSPSSAVARITIDPSPSIRMILFCTPMPA